MTNMNINNSIEEQLENIFSNIRICKLDHVSKRPKRYPYTKEQWTPKVLHYYCFNDLVYTETVYINIHTRDIVNSGVIYGK